jgi:hypothetical protein
LRNISFAHTTQQVRDRRKTVTRRVGWRFLRPGERLSAIVKSRGLPKGESVQRLATIRVVDVREERLDRMVEDWEYGVTECKLEGFANDAILCNPKHFVAWFAVNHGCHEDSPVTRIEFEYE